MKHFQSDGTRSEDFFIIKDPFFNSTTLSTYLVVHVRLCV